MALVFPVSVVGMSGCGVGVSGSIVGMSGCGVSVSGSVAVVSVCGADVSASDRAVSSCNSIVVQSAANITVFGISIDTESTPKKISFRNLFDIKNSSL